MKKIVWTRADGGLSVSIPAYNDKMRARNNDGSFKHTDEEFLVYADSTRQRNEDNSYTQTDKEFLAYAEPTRPRNPDGTYVQSDDELLQSVIDRVVPDGVTAHVVDDEDAAVKSTLEDRTFRDAWEWKASSVKVNMPKARAIHMEKIRKVRNEELAKLDIPYMRAVEDGDTTAQSTIKEKKQVLRDIPANFKLSSYKTPEKLAAAFPSELPVEEK